MTQKSALTLLEPATILGDVYKTLSPEPLLTPPQIQAFYRGGINDVRGGDKVDRMAMGLGRSWQADYYKAFLGGHPGVGKSTELTRLVERVSDRFRAIRFQVTKDLDPGSFKPFDVLLLMMIKVVEETAKPVSEGGSGKVPSEGLLQQINDWFDKEEAVITTSVKTGIDLEAGMGPSTASVWQKVLGWFASVKGEIKYASDRSTKKIEYRLQLVSSLLDMVNKLLNECNERLREVTGLEWMFIGEEFDRPGIPITLVEDFFLNYGNIFKDIQVHTIFTVPIGLAYSERATQLPCPSDRIQIVPDTPVFDRNHNDCREGRAALQEILEARASPKLFGKSQMKRLIIASGGNLRDLFTMVNLAADLALLHRPAKNMIGKAEVDRAINELRTDYTRKLGVGPYDPAELTYKQKADRLVAVYNQDPDHDIPDPVLYSLLNARAVQEFNGERWFGVHPLVVDVLRRQRRLIADANGKVPGGTE
ncbi:MAG: hypothetical protein ACLQGP_23000 [Isosphaeraceae bacterium]